MPPPVANSPAGQLTLPPFCAPDGFAMAPEVTVVSLTGPAGPAAPPAPAAPVAPCRPVAPVFPRGPTLLQLIFRSPRRHLDFRYRSPLALLTHALTVPPPLAAMA